MLLNFNLFIFNNLHQYLYRLYQHLIITNKTIPNHFFDMILLLLAQCPLLALMDNPHNFYFLYLQLEIGPMMGHICTYNRPNQRGWRFTAPVLTEYLSGCRSLSACGYCCSHTRIPFHHVYRQIQETDGPYLGLQIVIMPRHIPRAISLISVSLISSHSLAVATLQYD